jgi:hypothetical protein
MSGVHPRRFVLRAAFLGLLLAHQPLNGQILHVCELTVTEIESLHKQEVVVLLPGGILEQHGPYLPSFSDGYMNQRLTSAVAKEGRTRSAASTPFRERMRSERRR